LDENFHPGRGRGWANEFLFHLKAFDVKEKMVNGWCIPPVGWLINLCSSELEGKP
jgi:hypothetical protein